MEKLLNDIDDNLRAEGLYLESLRGYFAKTLYWRDLILWKISFYMNLEVIHHMILRNL